MLVDDRVPASCKRFLRILASLLLPAFSLLSCEDVIQVKLSDQNLNLLGVEAAITTKSKPTVFLYKTLQVNKDEPFTGISGAEVLLSDDATPSNSVKLVEDPLKKGFYQVPSNSGYMGFPGRTYSLTIQSQGVTLNAKEMLARVEPIDSIQIVPSTRGNGIFLGIFTYGKEPKGRGNFYKWDVFVNDSLIHNADRISVASDEFVDGNYIAKLEVYTDFHDPAKPQDRKLNLKDTIYVKQTSISEFAYNFYLQMINQSSTGSLFSVPPANIKSNITANDGKPVLGIFSARDVSVSNKVIIDQSLENQLKK